jgi:uncharacterized protein (TIGR02246 family)
MWNAERMARITKSVCVALILVATSTFVRAQVSSNAKGDAARVAEIRSFNDQFTANILKMDHAAIVAQWAEDGVSILEGAEPLVGRAAIQKMMDDVVTKMPGYKVTTQEDDFRDISVSGDWASEWALTHQVVQPPDGKPVIEIRGKMLLVLHREKDGQWKIEREMWTR